MHTPPGENEYISVNVSLFVIYIIYTFPLYPLTPPHHSATSPPPARPTQKDILQ